MSLPADRRSEGPQLRRYFEKTLSFIRSAQLMLQRSLNKGTVASGFKETKSGKPRVLPLSQRCKQALARLKAD